MESNKATSELCHPPLQHADVFGYLVLEPFTVAPSIRFTSLCSIGFFTNKFWKSAFVWEKKYLFCLLFGLKCLWDDSSRCQDILWQRFALRLWRDSPKSEVVRLGHKDGVEAGFRWSEKSNGEKIRGATKKAPKLLTLDISQPLCPELCSTPAASCQEDHSMPCFWGLFYNGTFLLGLYTLGLLSWRHLLWKSMTAESFFEALPISKKAWSEILFEATTHLIQTGLISGVRSDKGSSPTCWFLRPRRWRSRHRRIARTWRSEEKAKWIKTRRSELI